MSLSAAISSSDADVILRVHVQPRASREQVVAMHGDRVKLAVTAAAQRGAANEAVIRLVATSLGVPRSRVTLLRGATSRQKDLLIQGVSADVVTSALATHLPPDPQASP